MKLNKAILAVALGLALLAVAAAPSHAVPVLRLTADGGVPVTITDGGGGDFNGATGAITFIGPVGVFEVNILVRLDIRDEETLLLQVALQPPELGGLPAPTVAGEELDQRFFRPDDPPPALHGRVAVASSPGCQIDVTLIACRERLCRIAGVESVFEARGR